jgi:hypothetical protein
MKFLLAAIAALCLFSATAPAQSAASPDPSVWTMPVLDPSIICAPINPGFYAYFKANCLRQAIEDHKDCWNASGGPRDLAQAAMAAEAAGNLTLAATLWGQFQLAVFDCRIALVETLNDPSDPSRDCCAYEPLMPGPVTETAINGYVEGTVQLHPSDVQRFQTLGMLPAPVAQVGDVFACPPVYPGRPPAALCDIPETYRPACLALAKFNHKLGWENYVRTFSLARCSALDTIIDKLLAIQGHQQILDDLQDDYDDEVLDCITGVPGACDRAHAIAVQMVTIQGWINDLNAEITVLRNAVAGYNSAITLNMADIGTKFYNATLACCGPEDEEDAPE